MRTVMAMPGGSWITQLGQVERYRLPGGVWETTDHGVIVPRNSLVLPMTGFGAAEGRFKFSTTTGVEWAGGVSNGIGSLTADVRQSISAANPHIGFAIDGVESIIRAATGENPGMNVAFAVVDMLANVLTQVMKGDAALGTAVSSAAGAVGQTGAIVGAAVMVAKFIISAIVDATAPEISRAELQAMKQKFQNYCNATTKPDNMKHPRVMVGTGAGAAVTPADMVAQGDQRIRLWEMLCAGAARNKGQRDSYNAWLRSASKTYKITGIPLHIQRQMVTLLEGIYAARINPESPLGTDIGDGGETLFNILAQITYQEGTKQKPAFNLASLRSMADKFISPGKQVCIREQEVTPGIQGAGIDCKTFGPCRSEFPEIDVGFSLYNFLWGYGKDLRDKRRWDQAGGDIAFQQKKSRFVLSKASTARLVVSTKVTANAAAAAARKRSAEAAAEKRKQALENNRKAAIATTTVVAGGGALWFARRLAKKRRGR